MTGDFGGHSLDYIAFSDQPLALRKLGISAGSGGFVP
jgi:hypothetical protein